VALDPSRHWLAAGITGLSRGREWDAVRTAEGPGTPGDEVQFVGLQDGRLLLESGAPEFDATPLADALEGALERPYRALAHRRPEMWVVGALEIEVVELDATLRGDTLELVRDDTGVRVRVDEMPASDHVPQLETLGEARSESYVVRANRLAGSLFEVEVESL
jgi:hypothetical protein